MILDGTSRGGRPYRVLQNDEGARGVEGREGRHVLGRHAGEKLWPKRSELGRAVDSLVKGRIAFDKLMTRICELEGEKSKADQVGVDPPAPSIFIRPGRKPFRFPPTNASSRMTGDAQAQRRQERSGPAVGTGTTPGGVGVLAGETARRPEATARRPERPRGGSEPPVDFGHRPDGHPGHQGRPRTDPSAGAARLRVGQAGAGRGGAAGPHQGRVPRQPLPRDPHPAQRHPRLVPDAQAGQDPRGGTGRGAGSHHPQRPHPSQARSTTCWT